MTFNKKWYFDLLIAVLFSAIAEGTIYPFTKEILFLVIGIPCCLFLFLAILGIHNLIIQVGRKKENIWILALAVFALTGIYSSSILSLESINDIALKTVLILIFSISVFFFLLCLLIAEIKWKD